MFHFYSLFFVFIFLLYPINRTSLIIILMRNSKKINVVIAMYMYADIHYLKFLL